MKPFSNIGLNQQQANKLFEGEEIQQGQDYGFVTFIVLSSAAWSTFIPVAFGFSIITLGINFLV